MTKTLNLELVKYIEKHLKKGVHINQIKKTLIEVGHPISAIEDAASFVLAKQTSKMPKFMIVYGIILILLISLFGWFVWYKLTEHSEYTSVVTQIEQNKSYLAMSDVTLLKLAAANNDTSVCNFIKEHNMRYSCLASSWIRDDCEYEYFIQEGDECHLKKALQQGNITECSFLAVNSSKCREEVIQKTGAIDLCDDIDCVISIAKKTNDTTVCSKIKIRLLHSDKDINSIDMCKFSLAIELNDKNICENISSAPLKKDCQTIFGSSEELRQTCKQYSQSKHPENAQYYVVLCMLDFIEIIKNPEYCSLFDSQSFYEYQKLEDSFSKTNILDTNFLQQLKIFDYCTYKVAYLKADQTICSRIADTTWKNSCEQSVSSQSCTVLQPSFSAFCARYII